jgi:hypothetical protein
LLLHVGALLLSAAACELQLDPAGLALHLLLLMRLAAGEPAMFASSLGSCS